MAEEVAPRRGRRGSGAFLDAEVCTGIDWITFLTDTRSEGDAIEEIANEWKEIDLGVGSKLKGFSWQGYRGWATASVRRGWMGHRSALLSSGAAAAFISTRLRSFSGRCTRLDVQATCSFSKTQLHFGRRAISLSTRSRQLPPSSRPRRGFSSDNRGCRIGTVGKRTGERYLRAYDKGVEAKALPPGYRWRLELEAKHDLAEGLWSDFRKATDVEGWCYARLEEQWRQSGCSWPLASSGSQLAPLARPEREPAPAHALLAWMRTSVAPTIPRVLTTYDVTEVLSALGLSDVAMARHRSDEHG